MKEKVAQTIGILMILVSMFATSPLSVNLQVGKKRKMTMYQMLGKHSVDGKVKTFFVMVITSNEPNQWLTYEEVVYRIMEGDRFIVDIDRPTSVRVHLTTSPDSTRRNNIDELPEL